MRYLIVLDTVIVGAAGTLDEAHRSISKRCRTPGLGRVLRYFDVADVWTEPGYIEQLGDVSYWRPA